MRIIQFIVLCSMAFFVQAARAQDKHRPYKDANERAVEAKIDDLDSAAVFEMGERKSARAKQVLMELADSADIPDRIAKKNRRADKTSDERMKKILRGRFLYAKHAAKISLARMGEKKYLREFGNELASDDLGKKKHAIASLVAVGDKRAVKHLIALLDDNRKPESKSPDMTPVPISSQAEEALDKLLPDVLEEFRKQNPGRRYGFGVEWKAWWKTNKNNFKDGLE